MCACVGHAEADVSFADTTGGRKKNSIEIFYTFLILFTVATFDYVDYVF